MIEVSVNDYQQEVACAYRGEEYLVRDNGAVLRKRRREKRKRPLDEKWTFGNPCAHSGYMKVSAVVVHRIVATAFLGEQPSEDQVVDHIDTNRRNNRADNLRWVTRAENILLNPVTRKRVITAYGSLEAFLEDPQKPANPDYLVNFDWMRSVSIEEARASRERLERWAASDAPPGGGSLGEWLFASGDQVTVTPEQHRDIDSLTPGATQRKWTWPCEFPACPEKTTNDALLGYSQGLTPGTVFSRNKFRSSSVISAEISEAGSSLVVLCELGAETIKPWANCRVTVEHGKFCHENLGSCFTLDGARKQYCVALGHDWEGEDSIDDFC